MEVIDLRDEQFFMQDYFEKFYDSSIWTWEGLSVEEDTFEQITKEFNLDKPTFFIYSGKQMNEYYKLTGDNKYPDNLTFVSIKDFYDVGKKLQYGARWFDDIVDNNNYREGRFEEEEE